MNKTKKRMSIGYVCLIAGIVAVAMLPAEMPYSRIDVAEFIGATSIGLWIIAAIVFVRK